MGANPPDYPRAEGGRVISRVRAGCSSATLSLCSPFRSMNLDTTHLILLLAGITLVAFLYSSVGHAGASGYIAVMTLCGLSATFIRPTALVLNILVATIGSFQFWRAGYFSWRLFWPFALLAIPAAYVGGYFARAATLLEILRGVLFIFLDAGFFFPHRGSAERPWAASFPSIGYLASHRFLLALARTWG